MKSLAAILLVLFCSNFAKADTLLEDFIDFTATVSSAGGYAVLKESELAKLKAEFEKEKALLLKKSIEVSKEIQQQHARDMVALFDLEIETYRVLSENARKSAQIFLAYLKELDPYLKQRALEEKRTTSMQARAGISKLILEESEMVQNKDQVLEKLRLECSNKNLVSCTRAKILENGLMIESLQQQLVAITDDQALLDLFEYILKSYHLNKDLEARNTKNMCQAVSQRKAYENMLSPVDKENLKSQFDQCMGKVIL